MCIGNRNYAQCILYAVMVNVLKFQTLVVRQKGLDKQRRPRSDYFFRSSLIRVCPVCYSDTHFVNFSPGNQHFISDQTEKSVREILEQLPYTVKPVLSGHSKITPKLVFKAHYRLMQVKSIAECSEGSILQYFRLSLSYCFPLRPLLCLF